MIKFLIKRMPGIGILFCIWMAGFILIIVNLVVSDIVEDDIIVFNNECSVSDISVGDSAVSVKMSCGDYDSVFSGNDAAMAIANTKYLDKTPTCKVTIGSLSDKETFTCNYE